MQPKFSKLLHEPLVWKSDGLFKHSCTLYHDEQPIAYFRQEGGLFKQDASIYLHDADEPLFTFRPKGVINTRVDVESTDIDFEAAKLKPFKWGGGITITFLNGSQYVWRAVDIWGNNWTLKSVDGIKIAKLTLDLWRTQGTITIVSDMPSPAELSLMVFAGWTQYLYEMQAV